MASIRQSSVQGLVTVQTAAYNDNGTRLATCSADGTIHVCDRSEDQEHWQLTSRLPTEISLKMVKVSPLPIYSFGTVQTVCVNQYSNSFFQAPCHTAPAGCLGPQRAWFCDCMRFSRRLGLYMAASSACSAKMLAAPCYLKRKHRGNH